MTKKELVKTKWAKEFKKDSPISYNEAISLALMPVVPVRIYKTDETGEWQWVIEPVLLSGFWMAGYKTRPECVALCDEMGWKYK